MDRKLSIRPNPYPQSASNRKKKIQLVSESSIPLWKELCPPALPHGLTHSLINCYWIVGTSHSSAFTFKIPRLHICCGMSRATLFGLSLPTKIFPCHPYSCFIVEQYWLIFFSFLSLLFPHPHRTQYLISKQVPLFLFPENILNLSMSLDLH